MRYRIVIGVLLTLGLSCFVGMLQAEDTPKPAVSDKARADFWYAVTQVQQADAAKAIADTAKAAAIAAMTKECGAWKLDQDRQTGQPVCVEPPAAKPEPVK